jgi:hypothetical protein
MTQPPGTSTIDALVQTVQRFWPEADDVRLVGRDDGGAPAGTEVLELAAAPNAASARLLVPVGHRVTAAALARYSSALTVREVAQRVAVGALTTAAGPVLLRDRVRVTSPGQDHLAAVVAEIVGGPVQLSLGIGTARANRKPVLGAFDPSGRPVAFVKVGDTQVSTAHVAAEAASLAELGRQRFTVIETPQLLGQRRWRDMEVVVMSPLRPRPWQGRDGRWPMPDAAMDELAEVFDGGRLRLVDTPWWARTTLAASQLQDPERRARLVAALDRVADVAGEVEVRVGAWHGDFTPWNMSRHGSRLLLWDWERFETGVPHGMDRVHYAVNTIARARGFGVGSVLDGLRAGATGDAEVDLTVAAAYLAALATRYLRGAQEDGGEVIADRADLVLSILSELTLHLAPVSQELQQP